MPSSTFNTVLASRSSDIIMVAEIYPSDSVPGAAGFSPVDALACLASVAGVSYMGEAYLQQVVKFPDITITDSGSFNSASVTLSNVDRWAATFVFAQEDSSIEGLYLVLRLISRSVSVDLDDSYVIFVGRCDKAGDADKKQMPISAKELLGSVDTTLPPRNFTTTDETGRRRNDPLYEGFPFIPALFTIAYQSSEPRGGVIASLFGLKKNVTKTFQASSHSALDPNKPVPIVLGRAQMQSQHIGYGDFGNSIAMLTGWADGLGTKIYDYHNIRNVDPAFTPLIRNAGDTWMNMSDGQNGYATYGEVGLVGGQVTTPIEGTVAPQVGLLHYSRTAWTYTYVNGSEVASDDAAPTLLCIIDGNVMPTNVLNDDWSEILFSDNPVDHARFIVTDNYLLNLPDGFIDDEFNVAARAYCEEILVDEVNTDTLVLPVVETGKAGTDYQHFKSTGVVTANHYKRLIAGDDDDEPWINEADYIFADRIPIENGGGGGEEDPTNPDPIGAVTKYRRRYTSNIAFTETQKAIDALVNNIYVSARMFHTYSPAGKLRFNIKKPADNTLIRADILATATEIPVYDILPWFTDLRGWILVGSDTIDGRSEVRVVTNAHYTTAGNSITLTASGGVTASGATFTGGTDTTTPATASLTCTDATTKTITIDGIPVIVTQAGGTTATIAGLIKDAINSHSILSFYVKASWAGAAVVQLESKLGFLVVAPLEFDHDGPIASPTTEPTGAAAAGGSLAAGDWLVAYSYEIETGETRISNTESFTVTANQKIAIGAITPPAGVTIVNWFLSRNANSTVLKFVHTNAGAAFNITDPPLGTARFAPQANDTGEEITRMDFVFSDRALTRTAQTRANIIADSFKWPLGGRQSSVNQIICKYREAVDDFRPTELRINDSRHQAKVGKKLPFELNLAAVDNFHQASRLANGKLAELRDADSFCSWGGGLESLLIDVGMVGCVTDFGSGLVNYMVRIEEKRIGGTGIPTMNFIGRKYAKSLYDDDVNEKTIGMPTGLGRPMLRTGRGVEVEITGGSYTLNAIERNSDAIAFIGTLASNATVLFPDEVVRKFTLTDNTVRAGFTLHANTETLGTPVVLAGGINSVGHNGLELFIE